MSLTDDGVLFAKNSDRDVNEAQQVWWYAGQSSPGATVRVTHTDIPQASRTHAIAVSRPWWMWGAEMGANEHGLVIGNEAVFTRGRSSDGALLGMDLLRLALERASTAREAVEVIVSLLEAHGQGGACSHADPKLTYDNSFLVADPSGAVVLETADRSWATEAVTGRGRSISNGLTIPAFARAHSNRLRTRVARASSRRAATTATATGATGVLDAFAGLRDHGGPAPSYSRINGALAAPCAHAGGLLTSTQTTASWVSDLGSGLHWVTGTSAPCTGIFRPITVESPMSMEETGDEFDPDADWWQHERLHRRVMRSGGVPWYAAERDAVERSWVASPPPPPDALRETRRLRSSWLVHAPDRPDDRPAWLRRKWRAWDQAAGIEASRRG